MRPPAEQPSGADVSSVVGGAIQNLVAARLARGFIPLAGLFLAGVVGLVGAKAGAVWIAAGAVATAGCMLSYGLAIVASTVKPSGFLRASFNAVCGVVPPSYGVFILGWPGLEAMAASASAVGFLLATLYVVLGVWVLRSWLRVVEVRRLARSMVLPHDVPGDSA